MDESHNQDDNGPSETKNVVGVDMRKARPIGILGGIITVPVTLYLLFTGLTDFSLGVFLLSWVSAIGVGLSMIYGTTEKRCLQITGVNRDDDTDYTERHDIPDEPTKSICRECHEEISSSVNRCPNCGWKPKKRGGLWWGTTAVMSLNPIGWVMGAKGASDNLKASKGVSKEVSANETREAQEEIEIPPESDRTDTLERLNELRNQGAITEAEFEAKKEELLDRI